MSITPTWPPPELTSLKSPGRFHDYDLRSRSPLSKVWVLEYSPIQGHFHESRGDDFDMSHPENLYLTVGVFDTFAELDMAVSAFAKLNHLVWVESKCRWCREEDLK